MQISEFTFENLKREKDKLGFQLQEVSKKLTEARAEGDLKENAAYDANKEELMNINARIANIEDILSVSEKVPFSDTPKLTVGSFMYCSIINANGETQEPHLYLLDSYGNILDGIVTIKSPLGKEVYNNTDGVYEIQAPGNKSIKYRVEKAPKSIAEDFKNLYVGVEGLFDKLEVTIKESRVDKDMTAEEMMSQLQEVRDSIE